MKVDNLEKNLTLDQDKLFSALNEREKDVLKSRYSIGGEKRTLSSIGESFKLSRERIRQIENRAKSKLVSKTKELEPEYFKNVFLMFESNGKFVSENSIAESLNSDVTKINFAKLLLDIHPNLEIIKGDNWVGRAWKSNNLTLNKINSMISTVEESLKNSGSPVPVTDLIRKLEIKPEFDKALFLSVANATNKFMIKKDKIGLTADRTINPKTVADKVLYILEESKRPLHFAEIAEEIEKYSFDRKKINKSTVHNELIANDKFVLIGRGIYAMKKWGYRSGTLEELIIDFLKNQKEAKSLVEIIDHINRERTIKRNTILVNLAKSKIICRTNEGKYFVKAV